MFEAFVLICASTLTTPDLDSCTYMQDTWGPYKTEENCWIRANQMTKDTLEGSLAPLAVLSLEQLYGPIEVFYAEAVCNKIKDLEA